MSVARPADSRWRGWADASGSDGEVVTSTRLPLGGAAVRRLFPKTRSWFALDSPMELLSPISVLRALYGAAMVFWPLVGLAWRWPGLNIGVVVSAGSLTVLVWAILLYLPTVSVRCGQALAVLWVLNTALLVWAGHGTGVAFGFVPFFGVMGIFVALFFSGRTLLLYQLVAAVALWVALVDALGSGSAAVVTAVAGVATGATAAAVFLLTRSSRRQGTLDADTGLLNGFGFASRLSGRDQGSPIAVAAVLVRGIAEAREALGYRVGSELLRRVVENIGQVLPSDALIGRVEGDIAVVARSLSVGPDREMAVDDAFQLAGTLNGAVGSGRYLIDGVEVSLRTATGLALGPWDGTEISELVRRASLSAHRAASEGRLWALWDGDRDALTAEDLAILAALRTAGARGQLSLVYQPQIACASGRPSSVEALLRWSSPEHGVVSPERFVPLAERTGLIDRLTGWILSEALDAQERWRAGNRRIRVSVNFSATTLARTDLVEWILGELASRDLPSSCLTVELTETAAADLPQAMERLGELRSHGVRVAVDDFGTGHTSLAALASLPVDELKIDRSFVQQSSSSPAHEAIVATFSELAHRLGLTAVAEGVEDQATERRLVDLGFDLLQGYHLARPLPEAELLGFVDASLGPADGADPGDDEGQGAGANPTIGEGGVAARPEVVKSPGTDPKNAASPPVGAW